MTATVAAPPRPVAAPSIAEPRTALLRRPLAACALLLVIYAGLSLANNPHGYLGTDTGGKVATLRSMQARGSLQPDIGYWAQAYDHDGVLHPLALTSRLGGEWVNVTTLPMLYAGYPLYLLGGLRGILLLPMLGGVLTALGARALARRLGGRGDLAFWAVGLLTPVVIYSLDFWEHTLGLAAMLGGVVLLLDVADRRAGWRGALLGGALFGVAATMRTEALVYAAVTVLVLAWSARRRRPHRPLGCATAAGVGLLVPLVANQALEQAILGTGLRAARTASAATGGGTDLWSRVQEALTTTVGLNRYAVPTDWVVGAVLAVVVALGVRRALDPDPAARRVGWVALGVAALGYAGWVHDGLGFLPGLLVASPLVVVGLVAARRRPAFARPVAIALIALPIVWLFQYGGGANPQWGGRYELCTGVLLAVVGCVALETTPWRVTAAVLALAGAVTGAGLAWLSVRSHAVADSVATVAAEPGPIVASGPGLLHFWREGGALYTPTRPWLTAEHARELPDAARVVAATGATSFTLVTLAPDAGPRQVGGYEAGPRRSVAFLAGLRLTLTRYTRAGPPRAGPG